MVKEKKLSKSSIAIIVLALLLVASLILGMTGAWFTSNAKNQGTADPLNFGEITISVTPGNYAVTRAVGTERIMPGDTINFGGTVTNTKDEAFVRYEMSITIELAAGKFLDAEDLDYTQATDTLGGTSAGELHDLVAAFRTAGYIYDQAHSDEDNSNEATKGKYVFIKVLAESAKVALASGRGENPTDNTLALGANVTIPTSLSDTAENGTVVVALDVYAVQQANYASTAWAAAGMTD